MLTSRGMAEHISAALKSGVRYATPFDLTVFKPFPDALYAKMIANLPDDEAYKPFRHRDAMRPDGSSTRALLALNDDGLALLPTAKREFWAAFSETIRSREVCLAFMRHLSRQLTARFGTPVEEIDCYPTARLGRDSTGYKILPHPDAATRVYTAQVYLAADESQRDLGTSIYEKRADGSFNAVRRLPFLPNTGFCFARTDATYHGVAPVVLHKPRNNLHMSGFHVDPGF